MMACGGCSVKQTASNGFRPLFNGKNFDGWYLKIRSGDQELAKRVFAIEDGMVHIFNDAFPDEYKLGTGEIDTHGLFYTKTEYSKFILKFEYKWGSKIANNFNKWQYDAGVYYHITNDSIWPTGIEYQIRYDHTKNRNHTGDLIRPPGTNYQWYSNEESETYLSPEDGGTRKNDKGWLHYAAPTDNHNSLNNQWNSCEVVVMGGDYVIHKLNGEVINAAFNINPSAGIIGFQAETAEIFYRSIQIKELQKKYPYRSVFRSVNL